MERERLSSHDVSAQPYAGRPLDPGRAGRLSRRLLSLAMVCLVLGAAAVVVTWFFSSEGGAGALALVLTVVAVAMVLRQAVLSEREG